MLLEHDGQEIRRVIAKGKVLNETIRDGLLHYRWPAARYVVIEMVASYGMPVGREVFDTCVWIGRFTEAALGRELPVDYIYRKEEKQLLCGTMQAKDSNIRQALVDRYAPGEPNYGKGTKKAPGFFYGFRADLWQAMAVGVTWFDKQKEADHENI